MGVFILAGALLPSCTFSANADPQGKPSFDCHKAVSPSEKTVCENVELSRLDFQLSRIWRTTLKDFDLDNRQTTVIKSDQNAWLVRRNLCGDDVNCLGKLYRDRLSVLDGTDPAHRFSGQFALMNFGGLTLYPIGARYLVVIQTAHPDDARWVCQLNGEAKPNGDDLEITVDDSVFQAHLRNAATLVVPNDQSTQAAAQKFCGLNGTFAETYHRVPLNLQSNKSSEGQK
jgi:uncharacterized protein